ncbi:MAG: IS30 family transposase [Nitrospirales bacterium]|nr:IS30 family transposase [Nitrospirales bacterium]NKB82736.1 IS30 family transposase [Nitrospirales bacterium]
MKSYQQLRQEERFYIWQARREGKTQKHVAETLGRHPSTVCRELKRNTYPQCHMYTYHWALQIVHHRKQCARRHKHRKLTDELSRLITQLVRQYLSPEQVSGYLKTHFAIRLSHETIYRFIYRDAIRKADLKPFLRQGGKHRRKRYGSGARASTIPNRVSITERPQEVEAKTRLGDWECDTVMGKDRKSVLVTVVDRASLYTACSRVLSRSATAVRAAIIRLLRPFKERVQTLIFDNGSEFVKHELVAHALEATTYFAHPYASWERGINENTNGLLRQFFPKRTNFRMVSWQQVRKAVTHLNNRPRKTRGYQTPNELFHKHFVPLV